jgi:ParB-like chromosome segregation protein Spo0J
MTRSGLPRLSREDFDAAVPLTRMTEARVEIARRVLVYGHTQASVAREYGVSRQSVLDCAKRFLGIVERLHGHVRSARHMARRGWITVTLTAPPAMVQGWIRALQRLEAHDPAQTKRAPTGRTRKSTRKPRKKPAV